MIVTNGSTSSPLHFRFWIPELPGFDWNCLAVVTPELEGQLLEAPNPFGQAPMSLGRLQTHDVVVTFEVEKNLANYNMILDWMQANAPSMALTLDVPNPGEATTAILLVLDSDNQGLVQFTFRDIVPTDLGEILFTATADDLVYITCQVTFACTNFDVTPVSQ